MKQEKMRFFKRVKNAVINFDSYPNFSEEKVSVSIKYLLKLVLIFSIVLNVALAIKINMEANKIVEIFKNEFPEFKFENNILVTEENKSFYKTNESGEIAIIADSQKNDVNEIENLGNYQIALILVKDKFIMKNGISKDIIISYEELGKEIDITNVNKNNATEFLEGNIIKRIYIIGILISSILLYGLYLVTIFIYVTLLSFIGYIVSKTVRIELKYKSIFNISAYAITFSFLLYLAYIIANMFTGFVIKYFDMAYDTIAYIYVITAILMIKSDLIKQQIEVGKIIEEQKKVREETEKNEEQEDKEENNENEDEENGNNEEEGTPEGSKA